METLDYDYEMLEKLIDEEVLCIVSTHLFGILSNVSELKKRYQGKGIFIIEDAAQAMGGVFQDGKLGTLGDAGFFSLGRGKNITTGTGGVILTSSDVIADAIQPIYRSLKREPPVEYAKNIFQVFFLHIFLNPMLYWFPSQLSFLKIGETIFHKDFPVYRLSGFKTGLLFQWESRLAKFNDHRSATSNLYIRTIQPPKNLLFYSSSYPFLRFPFYVKDSEEKAKICKDYSNFGISPMYPASINNIDEIKEIFDGSAYPGAEHVVNRLITLPTHCLLNVQDKLQLADMLKSLIH
jgi:dTDP-4-amino-4,6-dideoxygalactose transaminase